MSSADPRLPRLGLVRGRAEDARHLVEALSELGAAPLLEGSGADVSADAVLAEGIEVLVVGLGTEVEPALLDALDGVRVVFDDLEATATLTGWDRARWLRHLRAKLLGVAEEGPPRPPGAASIPMRPAASIAFDDEWHAPPPVAAMAESEPAAEAPAVDGVNAVEPATDVAADAGEWVSAPAQTGDDPDGPDAGLAAEPVSDARSPDAAFALEVTWSAAPDVDQGESPLEPELAASDTFTVADSPEGDPAPWVGFDEVAAGPPAGGDAVVGLDELLDALRREDPEQAERVGLAAAGDLSLVESTPPPEPAPPPRAFDLSSLSLEPLDDERPITGRAQFLVDEAPRAPAPAPERTAAPPVAATRAAATAISAWLLAAGDADPARVTRFAESLPAGLDALVLLVRPTSAPWLGATLPVEGADSLPLELADEVMEPTGGRIVVLSPGERAGFNRAGQLTVQPGDHSMPEALGDWMTMRALAARFGRDAGVVVFGRLRDEVLEGAIELARAGGQVWFEASVLEEPNPVVDAARAAGIAMRTGSAEELAQALVARLRP